MIKFIAQQRGRVAKLASEEGVPYSAVRKLLRGKEIKLNGKRIKEDLTCEKGDLIEIYYTPTQSRRTVDKVFEDANVLLVNKPAGITSEELFSLIREDYPTAEAVHRLDRNTCGLMVYALDRDSADELIKGFKERSFKKYYLAEVKGVPLRKTALLTAYLEKDEERGIVYIHDKKRDGDVEIKTAYTVLKGSGGVATLEVELITGKTHQIRAHLAHIGHPIVGDGKYGDNGFNRAMHADCQRLQAHRLIFAFEKTDKLYYLNGREFSVPAELKYEED